MMTHLKCYLSASYDADLSSIEKIFEKENIEIYGFYDGSIGTTFQDILKRKLRQIDFALFVITEVNQNIFYEIGVCEGLGKQSLLIFDHKVANLPFYLENQLTFTVNLSDTAALELAIKAFIKELPAKKAKPEKPQSNRMATPSYDEDIKEIFRGLLVQTRNLRADGKEFEMMHIVEEIFKTLRMKYMQNIRAKEFGIDFALWNDNLGRVIGNPIVVECKIGSITTERSKIALDQVTKYARVSDATLALLIYLDKNGRRIEQPEAGLPLILAFDLEDLLENLIFETFENLILSRRNAYVHTKRS